MQLYINIVRHSINNLNNFIQKNIYIIHFRSAAISSYLLPQLFYTSHINNRKHQSLDIFSCKTHCKFVKAIPQRMINNMPINKQLIIYKKNSNK